MGDEVRYEMCDSEKSGKQTLRVNTQGQVNRSGRRQRGQELTVSSFSVVSCEVNAVINYEYH